MLHHVFENLQTAAEVTEAVEKIKNLVTEKKINPTELSILDVAESTLGREGMRAMRNAGSDNAFMNVREAVSPVRLSAFSNITGLILTEGAVAGYNAPEFIGTGLVGAETAVEDGGVDIGLAPIEDDAVIVKEGEEFGDVRFGEDYIDIPKSEKRGLKIGITRELVFFDKTGKILEMAQTIGNRVGMNKEKRILRTILGIDNTFKRKGQALNTYVTTGPRINKKSGLPLVDWNTIDSANMLFMDMADDRTNPEPISVIPSTMLVMPDNLFKARRIMGATETRSVVGANTTISGNPVGVLPIVTSPLLKPLLVAAGISNAGAYWYLGDFKKAFKYRTLFPFQVRTAQNDVADFERDVVAQFRADERGVPRIVAPWNVAQFYDT